jgi:lipoyl(octanoyl) transferase
MNPSLLVKQLGVECYETCYQAMLDFTHSRETHTPDEVWLVQHPPVYTLGQTAKFATNCSVTIPVVASNRGGQITYHGLGQAILYVLLDLNRAHCWVRDLVWGLEESVILWLAEQGVAGHRSEHFGPGVYVHHQKIAAVGMRVRKGCTLHGLALNGPMDLAPFDAIAPCGHEELQVISTENLGLAQTVEDIQWGVLQQFETWWEHHKRINNP